jgi:hypothetical protein
MTMNRYFISKTNLTMLAIALSLPLAASAQTSSQPQPQSQPQQQGSSLADVARKMRAQKDASSADNLNRAQQVANELSEDQNAQHAKPAAPAAANPQPVSATAAPQADDKSAQTASAPAPTQSVVASSIPAGFKIYPFIYCSGAQHCFNASILVPVDAKLVSSDCKQSIFETNIQGTPFLLMAGPATCDGPAGPNLVRWNQLVDPETRRPPGTYNLISSQATTIDGKAANVVTIGFRKGLDSFMGKRVEVESNGIPLVVGCIAARDNFPDGDAACSTMMNSLQMP